jgi:hypothetical protein
MSATAPVTTAKLRLDDATRLIEKYGVDMADSIRNARKSPNPVRVGIFQKNQAEV